MVAAVTRAERAILDRHRTVNLLATSHDARRARRRARRPPCRGCAAVLSEAVGGGAGARPGGGASFRTSERVRVISGAPRRSGACRRSGARRARPRPPRTKPTAARSAGPSLRRAGVALGGDRARGSLAYAASYDAYFARMCSEKGVDADEARSVAAGGARARGGAVRGGEDAEGGEHRGRHLRAHDRRDDERGGHRSLRAGAAERSLRRGVLEPREQAKIKRAAEPSSLGQRVALVTGAASGIREWRPSRRLLSLGAHVVLVDRDRAELEATHTELGRGRAWQVTSWEADMTSDADVTLAASSTRCGDVRRAGPARWFRTRGRRPEGRLETTEEPPRCAPRSRVNLPGAQPRGARGDGGDGGAGARRVVCCSTRARRRSTRVPGSGPTRWPSRRWWR